MQIDLHLLVFFNLCVSRYYFNVLIYTSDYSEFLCRVAGGVVSTENSELGFSLNDRKIMDHF